MLIMCISRICVQPPHVPWLLGQEITSAPVAISAAKPAAWGFNGESAMNIGETIGKP